MAKRITEESIVRQRKRDVTSTKIAQDLKQDTYEDCEPEDGNDSSKDGQAHDTNHRYPDTNGN